MIAAGIALLPPGGPLLAGDAPSSPAAVVARVNGIPILASALSCAAEAPPSFLPLRSGQGNSPERRALELLVDLELLFQEGMRQRYPDLSAEVERRFEVEARRFPNREQFEYALRCGDLTEEGIRQSLLRNLVIERYLNQAVFDSIQVDGAQIARYYSENRQAMLRPEAARVLHILVRVESWSDPHAVQEAKARSQKIREETEAGGDFATLARRFSNEPASAGRGGDWGLVTRGTFGPEFDALIFGLEPGQIGGPISSHMGYHVLKVLERRPPEPRPLEEVKGEIVTLLRRREAEKRLAVLLDQLRRKAQIEILVP